ncbi:DSBA oxidoreductase [Acidomonas methanolica NBRC 104435]|uniref:DSBA oxidoreductase n=2 Tax=Acidomonas methanolica TaxID=437 RepID=A0A023D8S0_ACIMT|nr:DSBA oxidoreductase [Acidomonas methanolica NBRC 104435]GEK99688.1 hypothetical protein AME01nite_21870 [Acidomonas methanolica NBRC 104435]
MVLLAILLGIVAIGPAVARDIATAQLEDDLLQDKTSPVAGNPLGSVTIVEFFDYRCPYCRVMQQRLQALLAQDKSVRVVLKDWPIFGGVSVYAAEVAIASGWQGKYLPIHDALFTLPRQMDQAAIRRAAEQAGVDMAQLDRDLAQREGEIRQVLGKTDSEARMLEFQGTPAFVIGHHLIPGAVSLDDLAKLVTEAKAGR